MKNFENFEYLKKYPIENEEEILKNEFHSIFYQRLYFLQSNLNFECFQLSFDVHVNKTKGTLVHERG